MKNKGLNIVLTAVMFASLATSAFAVITPEDLTSKEKLRKNGYSELLGDFVQLKMAQTTFQDYQKETPEYYNYLPVKLIRKFCIYMDPALYRDDFGTHDIKPSLHYDEL